MACSPVQSLPTLQPSASQPQPRVSTACVFWRPGSCRPAPSCCPGSRLRGRSTLKLSSCHLQNVGRAQKGKAQKPIFQQGQQQPVKGSCAYYSWLAQQRPACPAAAAAAAGAAADTDEADDQPQPASPGWQQLQAPPPLLPSTAWLGGCSWPLAQQLLAQQLRWRGLALQPQALQDRAPGGGAGCCRRQQRHPGWRGCLGAGARAGPGPGPGRELLAGDSDEDELPDC